MTVRTAPLEELVGRLSRALLGKKRPRPSTSDAKVEPVKDAVMGASRAVMAVIAHDCTSFVEAVADHTQRVVREAQQKTSTRSIWLPSFIALGSADVAIAAITRARSSMGLEIVGAAGGVGLMLVSTFNLSRARTSEEALDATADLAWGVQGLTYVTGAARVASLTTGVGFVGAAARISVGALRIGRGVRSGDAQAVKLGTLDLGAGVLWAALDVAGFSHPLVLGSYVAMMVGREAYAHRDALRKALRLMPQRLLQSTPNFARACTNCATAP
jgi:hypothetical protein